MLSKKRQLFNLVFLIIFFAVTVTINICHTETGLEFDPACPACNFHNSSLATAVIHFFQLPMISLIEIMEDFVIIRHVDEVVVDFSSRSPPRVQL